MTSQDDPAGDAGPQIAPPALEQGDAAIPPQDRAAAPPEPPPAPAPAPSGGAAGNGSRNGDMRRTLHLPHGHANGPGRNGGAAPGHGLAAQPVGRQPTQPPYPQTARQPAAPLAAPGNGAPDRVTAEPHPKESGTIDRALRERVRADIAAFLAAFDAALADDTPESRAGLREATDRLLRAGARTRIELERLEARLPLSAGTRPALAPAWRQR
jgi:hypothetical protein